MTRNSKILLKRSVSIKARCLGPRLQPLTTALTPKTLGRSFNVNMLGKFGYEVEVNGQLILEPSSFIYQANKEQEQGIHSDRQVGLYPPVSDMLLYT